MRQQMKPGTGNCGENGQLPHEQKTCTDKRNTISEIKRGSLSGFLRMTLAVWTRLELATSCVTGRHSNQLNYHTV